MKKKLLSMVMLLSISAAVVTGCGEKSTSSNNIEENSKVEVQSNDKNEEKVEEAKTLTEETEAVKENKMKQITKADFEITVADTLIKIGGDMIKNQETMGEPDDYSAAKSCMGAGEDKTFTYGDVTIYTKPIDGMDKIYLIELYGSYELKSGITFGSSLEDVIAYYGDTDDIEGKEYFYSYEDLTVGFEVGDKGVSFIEIFGEE